VTVLGKEVTTLPWKETSPVEERLKFVNACIDKEDTMTALCRRFEISRKTGYKWLDRYLVGLEVDDRSSRPKTSPTAVERDMEAAILSARRQRPKWGARKLRAALQRAHPGVAFPSVSTFAAILKRNGLITPRRRRRRTPPSTAPLAHAHGPNALWCIDFKGDFLVGTRRCYPLTITDAFSRYLIACIALPDTKVTTVRRAMKPVFEVFGLPEAIRSDNGSPFAAASSLHGLTELSLWWRKLGIRHERIAPGKPQQNGRHERMHLTLKQETAMPPERSRRAQQRAFDRFRAEYNDQRPHEALGNAVPADFYERSRRSLPEPYFGADYEYPYLEYEPFHTDKTGAIYWIDQRRLHISDAFRNELLGARWRGGHWEVFFGRLLLGRVVRRDDRAQFLRADSPQFKRLVRREALLALEKCTPVAANPDKSLKGRAQAPSNRILVGSELAVFRRASREPRPSGAHASSSDANTTSVVLPWLG
jgi:putative transposase